MFERTLVIVDVQNDFCPGGSLAVPCGDEVVHPINKMIVLGLIRSWQIFASRDWHPPVTKHFQIAGGLWPVHCVQNTHGAEFHPNLTLPYSYKDFKIIDKGTGDTDDYSAFDGGMRPEAKHLLVGGLATDYCVLSTVKAAIGLGYKVTLLEDACRAVNISPGDGAKAIEEMKMLGAKISNSDMILPKFNELS